VWLSVEAHASGAFHSRFKELIVESIIHDKCYGSVRALLTNVDGERARLRLAAERAAVSTKQVNAEEGSIIRGEHKKKGAQEEGSIKRGAEQPLPNTSVQIGLTQLVEKRTLSCWLFSASKLFSVRKSCESIV